MHSLVQIAEELGLSKSTVSRALRGMPGVSEGTTRAVREVADRIGYVPSIAAAGLSTGRNEAIGVLVPSVERWFYATALSGVTRVLAAAGYDVVLFDLQRTTGMRRTFHRRLLRRRVDGLVVLSTEFTASEYAQLATLGMPLFAIGRRRVGDAARRGRRHRGGARRDEAPARPRALPDRAGRGLDPTG